MIAKRSWAAALAMALAVACVSAAGPGDESDAAHYTQASGTVSMVVGDTWSHTYSQPEARWIPGESAWESTFPVALSMTLSLGAYSNNWVAPDATYTARPTVPGTYSMTIQTWKDPWGTYGTTWNLTFVVTAPVQYYTVSYDANGGYTAASTQTVPQGGSVSVYGVTPGWLGHDFTGWLVSGTGTVVQPGQTITPTSNIVLVAQWVESAQNVYTIFFDLNGGSGGPSTLTHTTSADTHEFEIPLAVPVRNGYLFQKWLYNPGGTGTNMEFRPGDTFVFPPGWRTATLVAQWAGTVTVEIAPTATVQAASGSVLAHAPSIYPLEATLEVTLDSTGCGLSATSHTVSGSLMGLLPGSYTVMLTASCEGYASAVQVLTVVVPTFVYDEVTDVIEVNQTWTHTVVASPSSATITGSNVYKGLTQVTTGYSLSVTNKTVSAMFASTGTYTIQLVIGASGYGSATKNLVLTVVDPVATADPPRFDAISATPHPTLGAAYGFSLSNPRNYNSISWDFGDGSPMASGLTPLHQFTRSGDFTVTPTLRNTTTGVTYSQSITVSVTVGSVSHLDAWVGTYYTHSVPIPDDGASYALTTDVACPWLGLEEYGSGGGRMASVSGTPTQDFADRDVHVTVSSGATTIVEYTLHVWPRVTGEVRTGFSVSVDGYVVTLTNEGMTGYGVIMIVDWGTSDLVSGTNRQASSTTATAEYKATPGQYLVTMTLLANGEEHKSSRFVEVPQGLNRSITYHANGGIGSMPGQTGTSITVLACVFTRAGHSFVEWNTKAGGGGIAYNPGDVVYPSEDMALHAIWVEGTVKSAYFHANGGIGSMGSVKGVIVTIPTCSYTLSGRSFVEWNTRADGSGESISPGAVVRLDSDLDLYAIWAESGAPPLVRHTLSYDANGGTGSMDPQRGMAVEAKACGFSLEGHKFVEWNTRADGSGASYGPGEEVALDADATLYAMWAEEGDGPQGQLKWYWILVIFAAIAVAIAISKLIS